MAKDDKTSVGPVKAKANIPATPPKKNDSKAEIVGVEGQLADRSRQLHWLGALSRATAPTYEPAAVPTCEPAPVAVHKPSKLAASVFKRTTPSPTSCVFHCAAILTRCKQI